MTSRQRQKMDEREHFDLFMELLAECPVRLLRHDDHPDFLVERKGRAIGIEHTELFEERKCSSRRPHTPVELEEMQKRIVREAKDLYVAQGNPSTVVEVWFDPGMKRSKLVRGRSQAIAAELARFVAEWVCTAHSADEWARPGDRIPEIDYLSIYGRSSAWSKKNPSELGPPSVSVFQGAIAKKDTRYDVYRLKCDECWLLIVADRFNPAQGFDFTKDDSSLRHCYRSRFDRVFFLEWGHRWLRELLRSAPDDAIEPNE